MITTNMCQGDYDIALNLDDMHITTNQAITYLEDLSKNSHITFDNDMIFIKSLTYPDYPSPQPHKPQPDELLEFL